MTDMQVFWLCVCILIAAPSTSRIGDKLAEIAASLDEIAKILHREYMHRRGA